MKLSTFIKMGFGMSLGYSLGKATLHITERTCIMLADLALSKLEDKVLNKVQELEDELEESK